METDGAVRSASTSSNNPSKRRRISLACQACRTRKSRCDGRRPQCSTCQELDFDCVYLPSAASCNVIVGKEYLSGLENRLFEIEQRLNRIDSGRDASPSQLGASVRPRQGRVEIERGRFASGRTSGLVAVDEEDTHDGANEDSADCMGALVFTNEEYSGFFGPSSNIAFTRRLSRAMTRLSYTDENYSTPATQASLHLDGGLMRVSRPPSPSRFKERRNRGQSETQFSNLFALPPEDETLRLVQRYFSNTGLLFPYIHEETFLQTYEAMKKTNFTKVRKTWLGLLNMVLAFATSTTVASTMSAEQRAEMSDVYFQRALGLCDKHIWRGTSIELVQYLLMMGQYLQGTQKSIQTWTIHGLAVKAALQLGLHSAEASKRLSPIERETSKRLWYGCVILDRTLSMTFGRPAAIPDNYIRLELPVDYECTTLDASLLHVAKKNSTLFYTMTITLYKVMWNVVDLLYGANIGCGSSSSVFDMVTGLFKMEHQLMEWERSLPPSMALRKSREFPADGDDTERFRIILTLRYHNLRILIHRLVVVRFLDICGKTDRDELELALLQQTGSNSVQICVHSSQEIISIVSTIVHSTGVRRDWLGAWWFSLYYVFNAALVMSACILVDQKAGLAGLSSSISKMLSEFQRPIQAAVDALMLLDRGNRMIETCASFLTRLDQVVSSLIADSTIDSSMQPRFPGDDNAAVNYEGGTVPIPMPVEAGGANYQSPLGMDLGEFMMESDLDFLKYFAVGHPLACVPPEEDIG